MLPLGISTASAGLYQKGFLALPFPSEKPDTLDRTVLIWGGSSSVGSCAIQLAVASGLDVVTTASPRNFKYCKDLGAKQCFDYHDSDVEDQIVKALEGKTVVGAYHAVGADGAVQACARIVDRTKGKSIVVTVRGVPDSGIPSSVRTKASKYTLVTLNVPLVGLTACQSARARSSRTTLGHLSGESSSRRRSSRAPSCQHQIHSSSARNCGRCSLGWTSRRLGSAPPRSSSQTSRKGLVRIRSHYLLRQVLPKGTKPYENQAHFSILKILDGDQSSCHSIEHLLHDLQVTFGTDLPVRNRKPHSRRTIP